jgi:hypothetical protein
MESTPVKGYVEIKPAATTYKDRFLVEYAELKDRYTKLHRMIVKYDAKTLDFTPTCPIDLLRQQKSLMGQYLNVLEIRAEIEGITLPDTV